MKTADNVNIANVFHDPEEFLGMTFGFTKETLIDELSKIYQSEYFDEKENERRVINIKRAFNRYTSNVFYGYVINVSFMKNNKGIVEPILGLQFPMVDYSLALTYDDIKRMNAIPCKLYGTDDEVLVNIYDLCELNSNTEIHDNENFRLRSGPMIDELELYTHDSDDEKSVNETRYLRGIIASVDFHKSSYHVFPDVTYDVYIPEFNYTIKCLSNTFNLITDLSDIIPAGIDIVKKNMLKDYDYGDNTHLSVDKICSEATNKSYPGTMVKVPREFIIGNCEQSCIPPLSTMNFEWYSVDIKPETKSITFTNKSSRYYISSKCNYDNFVRRRFEMIKHFNVKDEVFIEVGDLLREYDIEDKESANKLIKVIREIKPNISDEDLFQSVLRCTVYKMKLFTHKHPYYDLTINVGMPNRSFKFDNIPSMTLMMNGYNTDKSIRDDLEFNNPILINPKSKISL